MVNHMLALQDFEVKVTHYLSSCIIVQSKPQVTTMNFNSGQRKNAIQPCAWKEENQNTGEQDCRYKFSEKYSKCRYYHLITRKGFPGGASVKNLPAIAGDIRDMGSIPGLGRSPGGGHGNPLQYSCLENPMDRGAWWATVHRVTMSWTQLK